VAGQTERAPKRKTKNSDAGGPSLGGNRFTIAISSTIEPRSKKNESHLLVEVEVEVLEGLLWVSKLRLLFSSLQQSIATTREFVADQAGEEFDGSHGFGLSLVEASFEHGGDSAES
jgi:hypothetical protein